MLAGERRIHMRRLLLAASMTAVLVACGDGYGDDDDVGGGTVAPVTRPDVPVPSPPVPSSTPRPSSPTTPPSVPRGTPIDPAMPLVVAAREDLAARLGIAADAVVVVEASAVTWGDSSMGCPEPGMRYLTQLVDGALVVLEAEGRRFQYHGGDPLFLCEHPAR
jgi:hypothetical protein